MRTTPIRWRSEPGEHTQQRRLSGAVRADEAADAPLRDLDGAVLQRPLGPEALAQRLSRDRGGHATFSASAASSVAASRLCMAGSSRPAARALSTHRARLRPSAR